MVSLGAGLAGQFWQLSSFRLDDAVADEAFFHALKLTSAVGMPEVNSCQNCTVLTPEQSCHAQHPPPQPAVCNAHLQDKGENKVRTAKINVV